MKMNSKFKTLLSHFPDWKQLIHDIEDKVFEVSDEYKGLFADPGHIDIHSHSKSKASGSKPVASGSSSTSTSLPPPQPSSSIRRKLPPPPPPPPFTPPLFSPASKTPTQPPPPPASKTPTPPPPPPSISKDHVPPNISSSNIQPTSVTNPALNLSTHEGKKENIENFNLMYFWHTYSLP